MCTSSFQREKVLRSYSCIVMYGEGVFEVLKDTLYGGKFSTFGDYKYVEI
jgi:hypothetical protein